MCAMRAADVGAMAHMRSSHPRVRLEPPCYFILCHAAMRTDDAHAEYPTPVSALKPRVAFG